MGLGALRTDVRTGQGRAKLLRLFVTIVVTAALMAPVTASAEIGASSSPVSTAAPDVRSANVANAAEKRVRVCFDQPVAGFAGNAAFFHLNGYNDDVVANGTSLGADANADCLLVDFDNSGSEVTQYTFVTIDAGAVKNTSLSNANNAGAVELDGISLGGGGLPGRTTGPDLTAAAKDNVVPNDVLYTHDEVLDPAPLACDPTKFGYWTNLGTSNVGATGCAVSPGSNVARVSFVDTTNAVRFFELRGAVRDRGEDTNTNADPNTFGSTTGVLSCVAPAVDAPNCTADLTAVNRIDDDEVDYTFDKGGGPTGPGGCDPADFFVFEEDTDQYQASACDVRSSSASSTIVRATFAQAPPADTANFSPFETPSAAVLFSALMGAGAPANTDGALPLGTSREASGFSDAPDLEDTDFDTSFNRVTYFLDENIDPTTLVHASFCVFDNNNVETCAPDGTALVSASGTQVVYNFPNAAINTAVGALMKTGAVQDFDQNASAEASVGRGPAPSAGTLQFSSPTFAVNENGTSATITVTRNGGSSGSASVDYSTSNGTANNSDYTPTNGTLSWGNGDSAPKTFQIQINDDALAEGDETVNLTLSNATGAALGAPSNAVLTIVDNDNNGTFVFSSPTYSASESGGTTSITVFRTGGSSGTATVNFSSSNGSATAGSDYTGVNGTLTFGPGVTSQTFNAPIINDTANEGNETVNLALSGAGGGANIGSPFTAVLTIVDDDTGLPGVLALGASSHSVNEDAGSQTITVLRTGGSTGTVTVQYSTGSGSAISGSDFQAVSGTLTFLNGEVSKTFLVPILNDGAHENTESFNVSLSNPTGGATLTAPNSATVSILDDDPAVPVTIQTGLSLRYKPRANVFKGRLFFPSGGTAEQLAACRSDRTVVVRRTNGGFQGSDVTGDFGRYSVLAFDPNGRYRATVFATGVRTLPDGSQVMCARGRSNTVFR
jgi:hypothetical protein